MNLNEVKKHVTFQLILYFLIGLCFILSLFAILATPVSASEMKQYNISQTIKGTESGASWGTYSGCLAGVSSVPCWTRNINTSYNESFNQIEMNIATNTWYQNAPSTIEIYNSSNSFVNTSYSCLLTASNSTNNIPCSVVYVNSGRIIVNFNTNLYSPQTLTVYTTNQNYLNNNYININKVMLLETVDSANSDVISNANQNTSDIINNANTNTNTIVDVLNENINNTNQTIWETNQNLFKELVNMCPNQLDINYVGNCVLNNNTGALVNCSSTITNRDNEHGAFYITTTETWKGISSGRIDVVSDKTYYLKFYWTSQNVSRLFYKIYFYDVNDVLFNTNGGYIDNTGSFSVSVTSPNQPLHPLSYARIDIELPTSGYVYIKELQFSPKNSSFCQYGTTNGNKLDGIEGAIQGGLDVVDQSIQDVNDTMQDVKDIQQDTYDYMTDDSNPSVPSSDINNVLGSVEVDDPLNYLLTLPISLLQKLNTVLSANSCSRVSFGTLYDTELYLPCINFENILGSTIWGTIDLIVGVGLLAIILKRFYDSISNILTMGKEKEVRDKLDLPTPMQFLASILGGGRD